MTETAYKPGRSTREPFTYHFSEECDPNDMLVLICFNGAKHRREAANLLASMKTNDPLAAKQMVVAINDAESRAFVEEHALSFVVIPPEINAEGNYGTREFISFTRRKLESIIVLLELGHTLIYTDTDIVFCGEVTKAVKDCMDRNRGHVFFAQQDGPSLRKKEQEQGHSEVCTGFMAFLPIFVNIANLRQCVSRLRDNNGQGPDDQGVICDAVARGQMYVHYFDEYLFANGARYFGHYCNWPGNTPSKHLLIHNNYTIGPDVKWKRLQEHNLVFI